MVYTVNSGFCYDVHRAKPLRYECFGTFINMFKGVVSFVMFIYILRKMFKNHRRALAGYTRNTISIDVHMTLMFMVGLWAVAWGATKIFDVSNTESDEKSHREFRLLALSLSLCFSLSSLCEVLILLLFCSRSIGKNDFTRSLALGSTWALATFVGLLAIISTYPGEETAYMLSSNMQFGVLFRNAMTCLFGAAAICYYFITKSDRHSMLTFSAYLFAIYCLQSIGDGLVFSSSFVGVNTGICMLDLFEIVHFIVFPAMCYFSLKRDCQYWSIGVDEDEETSMLGYTNEVGINLTWSEMPNYQDLVIPKTELFYRSTIVESVDMTVEVHLWRRKLACVKRFKFDLLTRDNIKYFKDEANIFKKISHESIVRFYGILIDPPSLGIVMQYCPNSDLFKNIEKKRLELRQTKAGVDKDSSGTLNPLSSRDSAKDKETPHLQNFAVRAKVMSLLDDHVVHNAVGNEEELQPIGGFSEEEDSFSESRRPFSARLTMKMTVSTRLSSAMSMRNLETRDTFEPMLIALQVARGMAYLHSQGITHRDLKSLNILLDDKFNAKIADFGESSFGETPEGEQSVGEIGTPGWAAPELLLGRGASKASDVFSFGVILWELLTFRAPSVLITLEMLQDPLVSNLPSTYDHPLLKAAKSPTKSTDKSSFSSSGLGFGGFFDRKLGVGLNDASSSEGKKGIIVQDHDLTMIEIGDIVTAKVLMCDMRLRPPFPMNLPPTLRSILQSCWCEDESARPSFTDIFADLEKMLVNHDFDKIDIPCEVETVVNRCEKKRRSSEVSVSSYGDVDLSTVV